MGVLVGEEKRVKKIRNNFSIGHGWEDVESMDDDMNDTLMRRRRRRGSIRATKKEMVIASFVGGPEKDILNLNIYIY